MNKKVFFVIMVLSIITVLHCFSQEINSSSNSNIDESSIVLADTSDTSLDSSSSNTYKAPSTTWVFVRMIIALVVIAALIYWVLRIIKKKTNIVKNEDDFLRRAASISVGTNQTVEVVTLIDRAYVIGVSEGKITLLDEITDEKERDKDLIESMNLNADKKQNTKKPVKFSEVLDMFTKKTSGSKNEKNKESIFNSSEQTLDNLIKKSGKGE